MHGFLDAGNGPHAELKPIPLPRQGAALQRASGADGGETAPADLARGHCGKNLRIRHFCLSCFAELFHSWFFGYGFFNWELQRGLDWTVRAERQLTAASRARRRMFCRCFEAVQLHLLLPLLTSCQNQRSDSFNYLCALSLRDRTLAFRRGHARRVCPCSGGMCCAIRWSWQ